MKMFNKKITFSLMTVLVLGAFSSMAVSKGKPEKNNVDKNSNKPEKEWYLRTSVSVIDVDELTYEGINSAVMGKLAESSDGFDKHDIKPYVSMAGSKAAVFFVQDNWGARSGEYHSNYHDNKGQSDSWLMTVVSTAPSADVTLNWDGLYALTSTKKENGSVSYKEKRTLDSKTLENLHLIDLKTLQVVDAVSFEGELNSYSFHMGQDTSRQFRWVLGPINSRYFEPGSHAMRYIKRQQRELDRQERNPEYALPNDDKFGLPPQ